MRPASTFVNQTSKFPIPLHFCDIYGQIIASHMLNCQRSAAWEQWHSPAHKTAKQHD